MQVSYKAELVLYIWHIWQRRFRLKKKKRKETSQFTKIWSTDLGNFTKAMNNENM